MKHFTISEMLKSDTAIRRCLWNGANLEVEENLRSLVEQVLDPLRERYGKPIYVNSGFRNETVNTGVHGVGGSKHLSGEAMDIRIDSVEQGKEYFMFIQKNVDFDQLLFEFNKRGAMWLHCSVCLDPKENRHQAILNYRV